MGLRYFLLEGTGMSATSGEEAGNPARFGVRKNWFVIGSLLWVAVLACGWAIWLVRGDTLTSSVALITQEGTIQTESDSDAEPPKPLVLNLPMNSTGVGDGQVIDLSKLVDRAKPEVAEPMWDPAGVEDFAFTNCDGRTITRADLLGRPWAICFVFTKCLGPCPTVTKQFRDLQLRLKDQDIKLVTLTVDPARDTPEVLANYAKLNGADLEKWYFLSGDQAEIYGLIHRSFRMPVQEVTGPDRKEGFEVIHSTNVMLVDAEGVVRGKFNAAKDTEMAELRRELQKLAEMPTESSEPSESTPLADGRE